MYRYVLILLLLPGLLFPDFRTYKARQGDSYYKIGTKFRIDYRELARLNGNRKLKAGDLIRVPMYFRYKIKSGDNYTRISKRFKIPVKELMKRNPKKKRLLIGDYLLIPKVADKVPTTVKQPKKTVKKKQDVKKRPPTDLHFACPVSGTVALDFGEIDSIQNYGLLFRLSRRRVIAAEKGVVVYSGAIRGMGNTVMISHPGEYVTMYCGLAKILPKSGDIVKRGSVLGSGGDLVFFSIFIEGSPEDPGSMVKVPKS